MGGKMENLTFPVNLSIGTIVLASVIFFLPPIALHCVDRRICTIIVFKQS